MNEPRGWTFLCIWYESRGFRVYEVKRHCFSFYMALCMPIHLRQRTSRVYQDHLHLCRVLTSFVPPVHNQGVSLAPLQGHALWKIFLLTTGSFFVLSLTDLSPMLPSPAPSGGRFPGSFPILSSLPVTAGFNSQSKLLKAQPNYDRALPACGLSPFITLPGFAVSGCHPSVFRHHSLHLLSVSCRIPSEPYTLPLLRTASSLMGFLCVSGNTHVSP